MVLFSEHHRTATAAEAEWLTQLYEEYSRPMWKYAYKILQDPQLADDVVQSTFQKIIEKIDVLRALDCNKRKAYIVIMVRNLAYTLCRQRKRTGCAELDPLLECLADTEETPEETVVRFCDYETVQKARDSLHPAYRDLLTMKYVYQYSDEEIARILDIKPASVRVVQHRALKALRKRLEEQQ